MIPGYRKIPLSRVMSATCHVMCDYCNFQCDKCIVNRKNKLMFGEFIIEELTAIKRKKLKVINGGNDNYYSKVSNY